MNLLQEIAEAAADVLQHIATNPTPLQRRV